MHDERFVNIFANVKHPHCPMAFNMMKFYNFKEEHVSAASKYVLLELSSHPNSQSAYMKTYMVNFPFVTYYVHLCMYLRDTFNFTLANMAPIDV
jgi:DNA mismatch repair ATPase MutS